MWAPTVVSHRERILVIAKANILNVNLIYTPTFPKFDGGLYGKEHQALLEIQLQGLLHLPGGYCINKDCNIDFLLFLATC